MPHSGGWGELDELLDDVDSSSALQIGEIFICLTPAHLFTFLAIMLSTILFGSAPKDEVSPSLQGALPYHYSSLNQDVAV